MKKIEKDFLKLIKEVSGSNTFTQNIGADPEVFIEDAFENVVPSDKILPKKNGNSKLDAYTDGVQAEFTVQESSCRESVLYYIQQSLVLLHDLVKKKSKDLRIVLKPLTFIGAKELGQISDYSATFGCKPDYNAYNNCSNVCNINGRTHKLRYGGGHIHLQCQYGGGDRVIMNTIKGDNGVSLAKFLDIIIGLPSVMLTRSNKELERIRRINYGRAGDYRLTSYGIEYRTPSNFWLKHPAVTSLVLGYAKWARNLYCELIRNAPKNNKLKYVNKFINLYNPKKVQDIINNSDVINAEKLYKNITAQFMEVWWNWEAPFNLKTTKFMLKNGIDVLFGNTFLVNWGIHPKYTNFKSGVCIHYNGIKPKYTEIYSIRNGIKNYGSELQKKMIMANNLYGITNQNTNDSKSKPKIDEGVKKIR